MSDMQFRAGTAADRDELFAMVEYLRGATVHILAPSGDDIDVNRIAKMIAAASIFAGIQFGQLIALGVAQDQDKRRTAEHMARNFRNGIDIGKKNAFRVAEALAGEVGHA